MIKAVIGKNNVEVYQDENLVASIWSDKIKLEALERTGKPVITMSHRLEGWLTFVYPDEVEYEEEKPTSEREGVK